MKILLSIKPQFVEKIFSGEKKYEFRKTEFKRKNIDSIIVYSSGNIKKIVGYYQKNNIPTDNFSKFLLDKYGLAVPIERIEISDKEELDKLNRELASFKERIALYSRLYNEQLNLNEIFKKEIGLSELKQWSPSETARRILMSKDFEPIIRKLLEDYSEIDKNKFQSKICELIEKEIFNEILNIHNEALKKEKNRIKEELKSVKKTVRNFE